MHKITQKHRERYGDVNRALSRFYVKAIKAAAERAGLDEDDLRRWFEESFITPMNTRNMVYRTPGSTAGRPNEVIDELENRHLIRAEWRAGARWYELSHDRLIQPIRASNEERFYGHRRPDVLDASRRANLALARAEQARSEGRYPDAIAGAEEALALCQQVGERAGRAAALMKLSEIRLELWELTEALEFVKSACEVYRELDDQLGLAEAYRRIGLIHHRMGESDTAIKHLEQALRIFRERADSVGTLRTLLGMLEVLTAQGDLEEAEALIRDGLELADVTDDRVLTANMLDYRGLVSYFRGEDERAVESWDRARDAYHAVGEPYSEGLMLQNIGYQLIRHENFSGAFDRFAQALAIFEEFGETADAINLLGFMSYSARKLGHLEFAVSLATRALELDPDDIAATEQRAEAYWELGRFEEALLDLDGALDLDPNSARAYNSRGQVLAALDRFEEALVNADRALELAQDDELTSAYAQAARGLALGGLARFSEALQDLEAALARAPGNARAFFYRALTLERMGDTEQARKDFGNALTANGPALPLFLRQHAEARLGAAVAEVAPS